MTHYICTGGCGGVSEKPGVCQDEMCPKHGKPLDKCECNDDSHEKRNPDEETPEEE